jgi:hypothetical protein
MREAGAVVIRIGKTEGLLWEIGMAAEIMRPERLLIALPSAGPSDFRRHQHEKYPHLRGQRYSEIREATSHLFPKGLPNVVGDSDFICFERNWEPKVLGGDVQALKWFADRLRTDSVPKLTDHPRVARKEVSVEIGSLLPSIIIISLGAAIQPMVLCQKNAVGVLLFLGLVFVVPFAFGAAWRRVDRTIKLVFAYLFSLGWLAVLLFSMWAGWGLYWMIVEPYTIDWEPFFYIVAIAFGIGCLSGWGWRRVDPYVGWAQVTITTLGWIAGGLLGTVVGVAMAPDRMRDVGPPCTVEGIIAGLLAGAVGGMIFLVQARAMLRRALADQKLWRQST